MKWLIALALLFSLVTLESADPTNRRRALLKQGTAAGGGGGFTNVNGIVLKLRGADTYTDDTGTTPTANSGDAVKWWADTSGSANHVTNASGDSLIRTNESSVAKVLVSTTAAQNYFQSAITNASMTVFARLHEIDGTRLVALGGGSSFFGPFGGDGFLFRDESDSGVTILSGVGPTTTEATWCGLKNGTSGTVYKDGSSVGTGTFSDSVSFSFIGKRTAGGQLSSGSIKEIRVYNRALSAGEIQYVTDDMNQ